MAHKLVIVESPAKARTIEGYLGDGYVVESSIGHIRDLPNNAADIPAKIKGEPWGRLAVDVDNGFTPYYVVPRDKKSHITKLKGLLKDADELYLATDEDREGEAIAWHLLDELKPKASRSTGWSSTRSPSRRSRPPSPTRATSTRTSSRPRRPAASSTASTATRSARSCGRRSCAACPPAACSPWRPGWSSTASGSGCAFRAASYWDLEGTFDAGATHEQRMFPARLHSVDGARVARGSDFGHDGRLKKADERRPPRPARAPRTLAAGLRDTTYDVRSVESKPYTRSPYAPFRTTTLQQEASRKLGFSASAHHVGRAAALRERLHHLHAYRLHDALGARRSAPPATRSRELYGAEYLPDSPRDLRLQGQERPGGARGDPSRRRLVPHPGADRLTGDAVPALRADLDAHRRLADEGRGRPVGHDPARRRRAPAARTSCSPRPAG